MGFHPPFQIDGSFGYAGGVNETLLQSHMGLAHLLPAFWELQDDPVNRCASCGSGRVDTVSSLSYDRLAGRDGSWGLTATPADARRIEWFRE